MAARGTPMQPPNSRSQGTVSCQDGGYGAHALVWGDHPDNYPGIRSGNPTGQPLLLLHGLPQSPDVFEPLAARLPRLGFRPIAPYLYGHLFKRPRVPGDYQLARFLDTALAVADRLELERFAVVGIGLGAAVGWMLAGRYPTRVSWLASIQFPHPAAAAATMEWAVPPGVPLRMPLDLGGDNRQCLTHSRPRMTPALMKLRKCRVRELLIEQGLPQCHLDVYADRMSAPGALEVALAWNAADPPEQLPQLHVPVLLVSNPGGHPARPGWVQQLVADGLAREALLEGTRFPLESASSELIALLEEHLPQR